MKPIRTLLLALCFVPMFSWADTLSLRSSPTVQESNTRTQRPTHDESSQQQNPKSTWESMWHRTWDDPIALYTLVLAVFTGVLGLVSSIQILFLSRADKTARTAANAAKDSAEALVNANVPYISPEPTGSTWMFHKGDAQPFRPDVRYKFANYGKSPATIIAFSDYLCLVESLPAEPIFPPSPVTQDREEVIAAESLGREIPCGLVMGINDWRPKTMTHMEIDEARDRGDGFFVVGRVTYDDVFGWRHTKHYCWRIWFDDEGSIRSSPSGDRKYNRRTKEKSPYA